MEDTIQVNQQLKLLSKINIPGCRGYEIHLKPKSNINDLEFKISGLFITKTNGDLEINQTDVKNVLPISSGKIKQGEVIWFQGPICFNMGNAGVSNFRAIFIEVA